MAQNARTKPGWLAKWRERRRRRDQRLAERLSRRPRDGTYSTDQVEHAVQSIPTSSGGMIG